MNEVEECPKCGGEMERGKELRPDSFHYVGSVHLLKTGDFIGNKISPFYCKKCGYIELYELLEPSFLTKCVKCGKEIPVASEECQYCGANQGVKP